MKKSLLFVFAAGFSMANFAQTTINGSDVNNYAGQTYTDNNTSYVSPGNAGANQTWDLSSLTSTGTLTTTVASATNNGANLSFSTGSGSIAYYSVNSSAMEMVELYTSNTTITYSNGEKALQYPLTYNSNYTDTFRATFMSGGIYPAVRAGQNMLTVDGYGTLILPNQTITDVLRINLQENYADTIDMAGSPYIINYSTNIYLWYRAGSHFPLANMTTANYGGQTTSYGTYTAATNVGIARIEGVESITILGNPVQSQLNFLVEANDSKEIEYSLVDLSGQVVYQTNTTTVLPGSNQLSINTDNLAKGMYALKISNGDAFISKLIVKE